MRARGAASTALAVLTAVGPLAVSARKAAAQASPIGLSEVRGQWLGPDESASYSLLGWALAAGDFNGDGVDDLAAGDPFGTEPGSCPLFCGLVVVRYGSPGSGLSAAPVTLLHEPPGAAAGSEFFGSALAAGDFDHDLFDDLAVGIPDNAPNERGAVQIFYGSQGGLDLENFEVVAELSAGEPEHACDEAHFGSALASGNFDGDAFVDLAVGAPYGCDTILGGPLIPGGSVFVFHGSANGLLPFSGYRMSQNSFGFDPVEDGDRFGTALAAGDFDAEGHDDLAIGVPWEDGHGAMQIVMGSQFGLIFANNAFWWPEALGELSEQFDQLGAALASADFDGDGHDDLAIGVPSEGLPDPDNTITIAGEVLIAYGSPAWFDLARTDDLTQGTIYDGVPLQEAHADSFGQSLAAGDFDGDGFADLAIGHPEDDWPGANHGAVTVLMGTVSGLEASTRFRLLATGWEGLPGSSDGRVQGGWGLAVGDFDMTGFADLAIGAPDNDIPGPEYRGGVAVLYGALFADGFEITTTDRW